MITGFYDMGLVRPSKFYLINTETDEETCIELDSSNYAEQMKKMAMIVKEQNLKEIYVSTENALPLEHILNNELIKNYNYTQETPVKFIYKKV